MTVVLFVLAAAFGAIARHLAVRITCSWQGLLVANTVGSAALGFLVGREVTGTALTVIGIGFCGALTTFGSFAILVRDLGARYGALYTASTLVCVCSAASLASTF
ncbi:MAG: CrcB family protein [Ilumatobacter sp.]